MALKPNCDDMRESPSVELAERLIGKGCKVTILDSVVKTSFLIGANQAYLEAHLVQLADLLVNAQELVDHAEIIVLTHHSADSKVVLSLLNENHEVMDLIGHNPVNMKAQFAGLVW